MVYDPEPFAWEFCPICGQSLTVHDDGQSSRPHCARCRRFYYSNPVPAACCFVSRGDGLLFVRRAVEPAKGLWTLPGGFIELGETAEQAALRELEEETGLNGRGTRLIGAKTTPSQSAGAVLVLGYLVEEWEGELRAASDAMELGFFTKSDRPPLAFQAHRELIQIYDALDEGSPKHGP